MAPDAFGLALRKDIPPKTALILRSSGRHTRVVTAHCRSFSALGVLQTQQRYVKFTAALLRCLFPLIALTGHARPVSLCPLSGAGSTGHCNTARSLSAGVSKPKVFRGR